MVLEPDARTAARLTAELTPHRVELKSSWAALGRSLARGGAEGCVVDLDYPDRETALDRVTRLRARHVEPALVAYGDFRGQGLELFRLGSLGVDGILTAGTLRSAPGAREVIELALAAARGRRVVANLRDAYPTEAALALAWATEHAAERPSVAEFGRAFGQTPDGIRQRLRQDGFPSPSRVLLWGRLLMAGSLLAGDGRTVEETAYVLGYTTASALTRAMRRETGLTPTEVARGGGATRVLDTLVEP